MTHPPNIAVVTDSSADLPDTWLQASGIHVVPQRIVLRGEHFEEGRDLSREEVYRRLQAGEDIHIGHPTPDDFRVMFRKMAADVTGIVVIALSTFFNPTMVSAEVAAVTYRKVPALALNSRTISAALGFIALDAAAAARQAATLEEVAEAARAALPRSHVLFAGRDWQRMRRHRHVPRRATWHQVIGRRPLITLVDGIPHTIGYASPSRLADALLTNLETRIQRPPVRAAVVHAADPDLAAEIQAAAQTRWHLEEIPIVTLTPVLAVRLGLGTVGLAVQESP